MGKKRVYMSFTECKNEFKFVFKTRKKLHNFVNDVKYTFPKVVLKITTFKEGNVCLIQKDKNSISVKKEIERISKRYG